MAFHEPPAGTVPESASGTVRQHTPPPHAALPTRPPRSVGCSAPGPRGRRSAGSARELGPDPAHRREHLPLLALPHAAVVGPRAADGLQRRLPADARQQAPTRLRCARTRGVAGDLARHRADAPPGGDRWWGDVVERPAAGPRPQRLPRGVLLHLLLQPDRRPGRRRGGRVLCRDRDDGPGAGRASAARRWRRWPGSSGATAASSWSSGPRPCSRATSATTRSPSSPTSTRRDHGRRWPRCSRSGCRPSSRAPGRGWPTCSGRPRARGGSTASRPTRTRGPGTWWRGTPTPSSNRRMPCAPARGPCCSSPSPRCGPGTTACGPTSSSAPRTSRAPWPASRRLDEERRRTEALAALDQAKSEFFTTVSHELRTPLTLISGPAQDALAAESRPEQRRRLELVERHTQRLTRLVDALLDFGRMDSGRHGARCRARRPGAGHPRARRELPPGRRARRPHVRRALRGPARAGRRGPGDVRAGGAEPA